MNKYELYKLYKTEVRSRSYDEPSARFEFDQALMNLRINFRGKYELLLELESRIENYLEVYALYIIEYAIKSANKKKTTNKDGCFLFLL